MNKGAFITFEGPEGSGKSTVIRAAAGYLRKNKIPYVLLREPGGTAIGEKIRAILLDRKHNRMTVEAELFLYLSARAQIVRERILPALNRGRAVLCDRFHDSTTAYQGYAGGLSLSALEVFGRFAKGGVEPDLTLLLDVEPRTGLKRAGRGDRMELKSLEFHRRVRRGFLALARKHPSRIKVLRDEKDVRVKIEGALRILGRYFSSRRRKAAR